MQILFPSNSGIEQPAYNSTSCTSDSFMQCFQIKQDLVLPADRPQVDEKGALDVRALCTEDNTPLRTSAKALGGVWSSVACCPVGQAICGIQAKIQPFQPGIDNTAVNGLRFACCYAPSGFVDFNIDLYFQPSVTSLAPQVITSFKNAVNRWSRAIRAPLNFTHTVGNAFVCNGVSLPLGTEVQNVAVIVDVANIDGYRGIQAKVGICKFLF